MKLTKSQFRKILKEATFDLDHWAAKIDLAISDLYSEIKLTRGELEGSIHDLEDNVMTINNKLSIKNPKNLVGPDVVSGTAKTTTDTNPRGMPTNEEIRRMVKEELDEVYSQKQRRWACAQSGESRKDFKGKPSLSSKEAEEMCKDTKLTKAKKK